MRNKRVVLAGPNTLMLEGLRLIIRRPYNAAASDCDIEIMPGDLPMLMRSLRVHPPDMVIVDTRSGLWSADKLVENLRACVPGVPIVVLAHDDQTVSSLSGGGRIRVLGPRASAAEFLQSFYSFEESDSPDANSASGTSFDFPDRTIMLTTRQMDVLRLLVAGMSVKAIAYALEISPRTVEFHKYRMMGALNMSSMPELIRFAIESGVGYGGESAYQRKIVRATGRGCPSASGDGDLLSCLGGS
jgi:DNA-binding NarL/FixJ family response regulator